MAIWQKTPAYLRMLAGLFMATTLAMATAEARTSRASSRARKATSQSMQIVVVKGKRAKKDGATMAIPTPSSGSTGVSFEAPVEALQAKVAGFQNDPKSLEDQSIDALESFANEALLAKIAQIMWRASSPNGWQTTQRLRLLSLENLMSNSAAEVPTTFNPKGFRLGTMAMRRNSAQRGVILTSTFLSTAPGDLRGLYREGRVISNFEAAEKQIIDFADDLAKRLQQGESKRSRYIPVQGAAAAWELTCDIVVAGNFCVSAQFFDTFDTDFTVLIDGLEGSEPENSPYSSLVGQIRAMKLAWPISHAFISRGYKTCICRAEHLGLDMTAPIGTPVHAVADGVVRNIKGYSGWGRTLVIEHVLPNGGKFISLYGHLSKYRKDLKEGDVIKRGEIVALTGNTGSSAGPHLHLEIRNAPEGKEPLQQPKSRADNPLDPMRVLDIFNLFVGGEK